MSQLFDQLTASLADRYRIEEEIGSGGMAVVYRAEDLKHGRTVALKVMRPELAQAVGTDRFLAEVQITARLDHPHIVPLLDSGDVDGFVFFSMPYVQGETLRERLERHGPLPVEDALAIARDVANALEYAHQQGVVHRDIKPGNIFLQSGHARLADFGISYAAGEAGGERLTATGLSVGTPPYMSPEQVAGDQRADARSDIYSLACVTHEMLLGAPPFTGASSRAVLSKHLAEEPPLITRERPEVGAHAATALVKALQKRPEDRQATAMEFAADLGRGAKVRRRIPERLRHLGVPLVAVALVAGGTWLLSRALAGGRAGESTEAEVLIDPNRIAIFPLHAASSDSGLDRLALQIGDMLAYLFNGETGPRAVDPLTVRRAWEDLTASGTVTPTEAQLRATAAGLGYGWMLTGTVSGTGPIVQVAARIENTVDGRELASKTVRWSSHPDSILGMIDALGVELAGLGAGEPRDRMIRVLGTSAEAREAYVAATRARRAGSFREARDRYEEALHHDSTFALAALGLIHNMWWYGEEKDFNWLDAMRIAWVNRSRLPPVDTLILNGHGGPAAIDPRGTDRARELEAWRTAVVQEPSRYEALNGLGDHLLHHGAVVDVPGHLDSAWHYLTRAFYSDTLWGASHAEVLNHLVDMAIARRDTAALQRFLPPYVRLGGAGALAHGLLAARVVDDEEGTDSLRAVLRREPSSDAAGIILNEAPFLGIGFEEADYIDAVTDADWAAPLRYKYALVRGRPRRAAKLAEQPVVRSYEVFLERTDRDLVLDALYSGEYREVGARAASRISSRLSDGVARGGEWLEPSRDACALAMWELEYGEVEAARATIAAFGSLDIPEERRITVGDLVGSELPAPIQLDAVNRTYPANCLSLTRAWLAARVGSTNAHEQLEELDAVMRTGVMRYEPLDERRLNLGLATAWETAGEPSRALSAIRRRSGYTTFQSTLAESLRDEGRLAAAVGDTAGAIDAYEYYLELRSDPEPELLPEVEEVRTQLAMLR